MNRLFYNRCYLAGPIDNATDFGIGWRQQVQQELTDLDLIFLDPCNKPMLDTEGTEDLENHQLRLQLKRDGEWDQVGKMMRTIRCIDLRLLDLSDFAIVHLDLNVYTTGTHEEITTLNRGKAPILVHIEQGKEFLPDWYHGTLPHQMIFSTWAELYQYVRTVARSKEKQETYGRWQFLDYGSLYGKRTIPLSTRSANCKGLVAQVSPEDHSSLSQRCWSAAIQRQPDVWRAMRKLKIAGQSVTRYMHHDVALRMGLSLEGGTQIDHIDRNPLNNTRENLHVTTRKATTPQV